MSSMSTWVYFYRMKGTVQWRADIQHKNAQLYGLKLDVSTGECLRVSMLSDEHFGEICTYLEDQVAKEQLLRNIFYRLKAFLRRNTGIRMDNAIESTEAVASGIAMKEWVMFHKTNRSEVTNEINYAANVVFGSGAELSGVQIIWTGESSVEIRLPTVQELQQAREFAKDPDNWNRICCEVRQMYIRKSEWAVRYTQQPYAFVPKEALRTGASASDTGEKLRVAEESDAAEDQVTNISIETQGNDVAIMCPANGDTTEDTDEAFQSAENTAETNETVLQRRQKANRYGRIKNSEDSGMLKYVPGNVLRPAEMINCMKEGKRYKPPRPNPAACISGLSNGTISVQDIEILAHISDFRFITSAMLIDLYGSGYIPHDKTVNFSQDRVNKHIKKLTRDGLMIPCRFISTNESGDFDFNRMSIGRIHVIDQLGSVLLRELGREATAYTFYVYQDGRTVRERLCVNQWVVYWLAAYPEVIGRKYGFNQVLYRLDYEMSGARLPAWVHVKDQLLIGQHVRSCDESEQET